MAVLVAALPAERALGALLLLYLGAAAAGEAWLGEARRSLPVQYSTYLVLLAIAGGHGAAAPFIAVTAIIVRWLQGRRHSAPSVVACVLPVAAGGAWLSSQAIPSTSLGAMSDDVQVFATALIAAVSFVLINASLVSLVTACDAPCVAWLRLQQHAGSLLRRHVEAAVVAGAAIAICNHFLRANGLVLLLSTYVALGVFVRAQWQRHQRERLALEALVRSIGWKDAYTAGHVMRVGELAMQLGGELGLACDAVERLGFAARVHDLGKVTVPDELLRLPGALDPGQRTLMESHTLGGEALLQGLGGICEAALVAGGHHERWDGTGYPRQLAGTAIPLVARITAVADAWDAMTSNRPYRQALPEARAGLEIEHGCGTQFDPAVVAAFARIRAGGRMSWSLVSASDAAPIVQ